MITLIHRYRRKVAMFYTKTAACTSRWLPAAFFIYFLISILLTNKNFNRPDDNTS